MRVRKITSLQRVLFFCLFLTQAAALAQTVSSLSPSNVTQRTTVTITGTGFTQSSTVRLYTTANTNTTTQVTTFSTEGYLAPTSTVFVDASTIRVILPAMAAAGGNAVQKSLRVFNGSAGSATVLNYTYTPPATTAASAGIKRVITNYNGYWSSSTTTNNNTLPDTGHSLMAFQYGDTLYSTGTEAAVTNVLNSSGSTGVYTAGNWRALPIRNLAGNVPTTSSNPNLIVLASKIDGDANASVPTAATVAGLSVRDVLIDGIRGLNLGTGVTNLPASSVLTFEATNILSNRINDNIPDIMVSQVADPSDASFSVYCFIDEDGNIVGKPVQVALNSVSRLGTYKTDFFTLPGGSPLNTATVNGWTTIGANTRPIRMVGYKLSEFGITTQNKDLVKSFKVMPSGTSDPAFMAYNRNSFEIPAPEITGQPQSVAKCPGETATFTVSVAATGTELGFQWEKNGVAISNGTTSWGSTVSGADTASLSISGISAQDYGIYRCVITNPAGSAFSNGATLNTIVLSQTTATTTCAASPATLSVNATGNTPQYQWYSNTTDSNTGGTIIASATNATYTPTAITSGTTYYYAEVYPQGFECAKVPSATIPYTISNISNAGTISDNQTVCPNTSATVTLTGYTGTIQWQSTTAADGASGWANIPGQTSASYTNNSVTGITYYRAIVTSGTCGSATSEVSSLTANTTYIWTGNTSTNWNTASNWSCNLVPTTSVDVSIPETLNKPIVNNDGTAFAKSLSVDTNAQLTIATGASLRIVNEISVIDGATFTVQNNGALLQDNETNNSGNITVLKNSNPLFRLDYTMWSSPVSGQQLKAFSPLTLNNRYYEYRFGTNSTTSLQAYWSVDPNTTYFTAGKGFLIRMPNSDATAGYNAGTTAIVHTGTFTGVPFNGTINVPMETELNRYTATGNPYASPINVSDFFTQNSAVLQNGSPIYLWRKRNNEVASSYATLTLAGLVANTGIINGTPTEGYTSGGQDQIQYYPAGGGANYILSQGQGFIVQSASGVASPQLTFNNSMRRIVPTTGQQGFLRSENNTASRLWINMTSTNNDFSQAAVAYIDGATLDIDYGYDGFKLNDSNLALYTLASENTLAIQARPEFDTTDIVPVGYTATEAGSYTISLDHVDGAFEDGQKIYLKDYSEGITRDLTQGSYTFTSEAGTVNDRFELRYTTESALGTDTPTLDANSIILFQKDNVISINSGSTEMTDVTIFDTRGRVIYTKNNINATETSINDLNAQQQVLIVEINTVKGKVSKKVLF